MCVTAHVHDFALEHILCVKRMQRFDERVLRAIQEIHVVALHGLLNEGQA